MTSLQAVTISSAFVFGMVLALLGSIKLPLAKRLGIGETRMGMLLSALNLALIPMMLLVGILIDLWGVRWVLVLGCLITGSALFLLTARRNYYAALAAILLAGLGAAAVSASSVVLMPRAFGGNESAALNLGMVFFALGSLVMPPLADMLLRRIQFRRTLGLLALVCMLPAFVALLVPRGQLTFQGQTSDLAGLLSKPNLWLAGLVFFLYAPLEGSVGTWATTYLTSLGSSERRAVWLLSGFWTMFLASRLLTAYLDLHLGAAAARWDPWLIMLPALLAAILLGHMAGAAYGTRPGFELLLLGFLMGPMFPNLVAIVFREFPNQQGTAYGAMFAIGSIGGLLLAPLMGLYARRQSVQLALRLPMLLALTLAGAALLLGLGRHP